MPDPYPFDCPACDAMLVVNAWDAEHGCFHLYPRIQFLAVHERVRGWRCPECGHAWPAYPLGAQPLPVGALHR